MGEQTDGGRTDAEQQQQGPDRTAGEAQVEGRTDQADGEVDHKAESRKWQRRSQDNLRELNKLQTRLAEIENQGKSELQRAVERAEAAERARAEAELKTLRLDVAARKGLPGAMAARLRGTTEDELESDADELATMIKARAANEGHQRDPDQGKGNGSSAATGDFNQWMRRAAGRQAGA